MPPDTPNHQGTPQNMTTIIKTETLQAAQAPAEKPDPQAMAECLKQLPQDSIEAESAHNQRQLEQWGASRLTQTEVPRK